MDKMKLETSNIADENFEKLKALFPNAVTETIVDDKIVRAVDKDKLMQEINTYVLEGPEERYNFTWPDKRKSVILANAPIRDTLRPCKEESVDFDNTQNLYIEGDNLKVLKLLRNTYMGKVKMIYIDPPYNTGKDFIYEDNFYQSVDEYKANSGQYDEDGNRLVENTESNGRFHTDWLNMMYPRLKMARDLLTDDGVIFISIDDNEVSNLKKICDEIFGEKNFVAELIWKSKSGGANDSSSLAVDHEYVLLYCKNKMYISTFITNTHNVTTRYNLQDEYGEYALDRLDKQSIRYSKSLDYIIKDKYGNIYKPQHKDPKHPNATWRWSKDKVEAEFDKLVFKNGCVYTKNYKKDYQIVRSLLVDEIYGRTRTGKTDFTELFQYPFFSSPKPISLLKFLLNIIQQTDSIILDFFSGSATTAHAVMQLNSEDGGNRKFIMVQLPAETPEKSEARAGGYKNIAEIGKERIRRAGTKIKEELLKTDKERADKLDTGFRVFKLDSSNMKDVYYRADDLSARDISSHISNIKEDRSNEDLLFQIILDAGIPLTCNIEIKNIKGGGNFYSVDDDFLIACFDNTIDEKIVEELANLHPYIAVFSQNITDNMLANIEWIFKDISSHTNVKVI